MCNPAFAEDFVALHPGECTGYCNLDFTPNPIFDTAR